eukprot:1723919-Amphidinium_carterae.1
MKESGNLCTHKFLRSCFVQACTEPTGRLWPKPSFKAQLQCKAMPTHPPLLPLKALHRRVSDAIREHSQEVGSGLRGCSTAKACTSLFDAESGFGVGHRHRQSSPNPEADHRSYTPPPGQSPRGGERPAGSRRVSFAHTPVTACFEITPYSQVYGLHPTAFEFDRAGHMQLVSAGQPVVACAPPHGMVPTAQGWIVPSFQAQ